MSFLSPLSIYFQSLGLYIITVDRDQGDLNDLTRVLFVQPFPISGPGAVRSYDISCMQLSDRRIYFTWGDARRRLDIPLFRDNKTGLDLLSPKASSTVEQLDELRYRVDLEFGRHHHTLIRDAAMSLTTTNHWPRQRVFPLVVLILACYLKVERERPKSISGIWTYASWYLLFLFFFFYL